MADKKKLLYIVRYQLDKPFHLKTKFDGQLRAFGSLDFDVYYLAFDSQHFYLIHNGQQETVGDTHFSIPGYFHTLCYPDLYALARKVLQKNSFDCVYWRSAPHFPTSLALARQIKKTGAQLIYEYPTYPTSTEKSLNLLRTIYSKYSAALRRKIDDLADGFVLIGEDAGGTYNGKPAVNISNGIDITAIPMRKFTPDPNAIHILALASMSYWHGYDRLIRSLEQYSGDWKVIIHMVGGNDGGAIPEWKALTVELDLQDKVIFHGSQTGDALNALFDLCDVGVNSLGMYRKGFNVTSELKTREYAARGLPFVCSVEDPALEHAQEPFWLRVSNDSSIPDMDAIVAFALQMRADTSAVEKIRTYAGKHLAWESQYRKVFEKINV